MGGLDLVGIGREVIPDEGAHIALECLPSWRLPVSRAGRMHQLQPCSGNTVAEGNRPSTSMPSRPARRPQQKKPKNRIVEWQSRAGTGGDGDDLTETRAPASIATFCARLASHRNGE